MPLEHHNDWRDLFTPPIAGGPAVRWTWRVLRKRGHPLLILPDAPRPAAEALKLYPAQTLVARTAKALLRAAPRAGLLCFGEKVALAVSADDALLKILSGLAGEPAAAVVAPAILAGNPATPGQRCIILAFDENRRPVAIVKAGMSEAARQLIKSEAAILSAFPQITPGVPRLRGTFQSQQLHALAMDYFPGDSPRPRDLHGLAPLLTSWLDPHKTICIGDIPAWARLRSAGGAAPLLLTLNHRLSQQSVRATLYHGDFAPWNIKVSRHDGSWTVLDWERGELTGIPGWDWFHYMIQSSILVERLPTAALARRVEALLGSRLFEAYAGAASIAASAHDLLLAYLLYNNEVIRPAEGLVPARELLTALAARWNQ
jgi:hypothetical protein